MDDEVCAELMFMQVTFASVHSRYCYFLSCRIALLTFSQQAQLKETIEKYGPVRQPVRETTLKILRCEVQRCCPTARLSQRAPYPVSLFSHWALDCDLVGLQVGL
jgi:hypothetical protein